MTEKKNDPQDIRHKYELTDAGTRKARRRRHLLWWLGAAVVAVAIAAIPLKIHPVDNWIHRLLGDSERGRMADMSAQQTATSGKRKILFYRNPMDPTITSPVPTKDSMGMDYVPVYADEAGGAPAKANAAQDADADGKGKERKILFYRNPMDPTITSPVPTKDSMGMDYVPVYA
ncbi:MAG TPA: hypothetical protein VKA53_06360, partial [Thermoanaerobaculia bacterium]|nr:hypothetical protein [Thermoanaerobaculia bacterium]